MTTVITAWGVFLMSTPFSATITPEFSGERISMRLPVIANYGCCDDATGGCSCNREKAEGRKSRITK